MAIDFSTLVEGKAVGRIVCALVAGVMLAEVISGPNSSTTVAPTLPSGARGTEMFTNVVTAPAKANGIANTRIGYPVQLLGKVVPGRAMQIRTSQNHWEKLALTAIRAINRASSVRDISLKAVGEEVADALSKVDAETKEKISEMAEAAALKASDMAGVTAPLGFFDPLGFSTDIPEGKLLFYREVELKHGRVGMLAALGILVGENFHPLFGGGIDLPAYLQFQFTPLQTFWPAVLFAIAIPEVFSVFTFNPPEASTNKNTGPWTIRSDHKPGDFGFDPLGLKPTDPQEFKEMQTKELNNGRLAMIAAAGMLAQELATNRKILDAPF